MFEVALLFTLMVARAAEPEAADPVYLVCLSDGQRLSGVRLFHRKDDPDVQDSLELQVAGEVVRIPAYAATLPSVDLFPPQCPDRLRWAAGRLDGIRIVHLPGEQRLYGQAVSTSGEDTVITLLDHQRIYVPPELVLDVTVPQEKDPVVARARRQQGAFIAGTTAAMTVVLGAFVAGAVTCPECFVLSGL